MAGKQTRVRNLARGFASALRDRKAHHSSHAVPGAAQGLKRFGQAKPERADHTRCRNCHAGWIIRAVSPVSLSHFWHQKLTLICIAFLKEAFYK